MSKALHFIKAEGKQLPEGYLQEVVKEHNASLGLAVVHEDHIVVARQKDVELTPDSISNLANHENFKAQPVLINAQDAVTFQEDIGPFSMLEDGTEQSILVMALDGQFEGDEASSHTPASIAADAIKRRIKKMYTACGNDISKLMSEMETNENFSQYVLDMIEGDRGSISFMSCEGKFLHIRTKDDASSGDTSFGWTSNNLGWSEKPAAQEKPKNALESMMGAVFGTSKSKKLPPIPGSDKPIASVEPVTPKPSAEPAPSVQPDTPKQGTDGGTVVPPASPEDILVLPIPSNVMADMGRKKNYLQGRCPGGVLPKDWQTMKEVRVKRAGAPTKFLKDWTRAQGMGALIIHAQAAKTDTAIPPKAVEAIKQATATGKKQLPPIPGAGPQPEVVEAKKQGEYPPKKDGELRKDTATHTVSNDKKGIVEGPIAIIPPGSKAKIMAILESIDFKGAVDRHSQVIADPKKAQMLEDKIPNLAHQLGIGELSATDNWPYAELLRIAKEAPEGVAILCVNWRSEAKKYEQLANELLVENETLKKAQQPVRSPAAEMLNKRRLPPIPA